MNPDQHSLPKLLLSLGSCLPHPALAVLQGCKNIINKLKTARCGSLKVGISLSFHSWPYHERFGIWPLLPYCTAAERCFWAALALIFTLSRHSTLYLKTSLCRWAPVTHTYNPNYSGGKDQEDRGSKLSQASSSQDPISKNPSQK
jgi:hypothetical protein